MKNEELISAIKNNKELTKQIIKMWKEEAKAEEIVAILAGEGIEATVENIEDLCAEMQNSKAKEIGLQPMDEEQLSAVTGGTDCGSNYAMDEDIPNGTHLGKCSEEYLTRECSATVETGSWCWSNDMCFVMSEVYHCVSNT